MVNGSRAWWMLERAVERVEHRMVLPFFSSFLGVLIWVSFFHSLFGISIEVVL
jgi:succinate dehydrogenase/fumarate reductase cytochrome b subunit